MRTLGYVVLAVIVLCIAFAVYRHFASVPAETAPISTETETGLSDETNAVDASSETTAATETE